MPSYSNPSSVTVTVWVRPCHSRTSRAPGFRLRPGGGANPTRGLEHLCQRLQLATGRLAESAVFDFLKAIADRTDQQVATDPWRLAAVQPPPFAAQLIKVGPVPAKLRRGRRCRLHRSLDHGLCGRTVGGVGLRLRLPGFADDDAVDAIAIALLGI